MPVHLSHTTDESQVDQTIDIIFAAFAHSAVAQSTLPRGFTPGARQYWLNEELRSLNQPRRGFHLLNVTDTDTGEVMTISHWRLEDKETYNEPEDEEQPVPEDFNVVAMQDFYPLIKRIRKRIMGDKQYWHLKLLATKPGVQRRGAGSLVMRWGIDQADEAGLECYLDATAMGKPLYERWGFEVVETTDWDASKYGVNLPYTSYHMVRKPKSKK